MKMASTSFISFLILFILLNVRSSTAILTHQGKEKIVAAKDVLNSAAMAIEVTSKLRLEGRKIMRMRRVLVKEMKDEVLNTEQGIISGAAHGQLNNRMVGFTTFSSDYHVPKSHPPKNNR
ncbi:uncharacterized protein LOC126675499 [Mercurialis annua]|uniref:uncharacterized protein LOC126675499 n=1 Tax=Mercurialis annua TaxID=3986 RepID=UPI002160A240|nr:uncharacterized protein LOC126675499 [Mercurialis annua]